MPERVYVSTEPRDMRAGAQALAASVAAGLGMDPCDGSLYCFVSRDLRKAKMLRMGPGGWCVYHVRLARGTFRWRHGGDAPAVAVDRRQLLWLLAGLDPSEAAATPAARNVI